MSLPENIDIYPLANKERILAELRKEILYKSSLLSKLRALITGKKVPPELQEFIDKFISDNFRVFINEAQGQMLEEDLISIESLKLPIILQGVFQALELQVSLQSSDSIDKIEDEDILSVIQILASLSSLDYDVKSRYIRATSGFLEKRKKTLELSKNPDFIKELFNSISKSFKNQELLNHPFELIQGTTGPVILLKRTFKLDSNLGIAHKFEYESEQYIIPIVLFNKPEKIVLNTQRHEEFHIFSKFISSEKRAGYIDLDDENSSSSKEFYENIIGERFIDEIFATLGGIQGDFELNKFLFLDTENTDEYSREFLEFSFRTIKKEFMLTYFPKFLSGIPNPKLIEKFKMYTDRIFSLSIDNPDSMELIAFAIMVSNFNDLGSSLDRLERFLDKYSKRKR